MKEEIKNEWVRRLTSGDYKQTTGRLHDENGYCCLGVLCEIAVDNGVIPAAKKINPSDPDVDRIQYKYERSFELLPVKVRQWAGISKCGDFKAYDDEMEIYYSANLAEFNDEGSTFEEIAEIIREKF